MSNLDQPTLNAWSANLSNPQGGALLPTNRITYDVTERLSLIENINLPENIHLNFIDDGQFDVQDGKVLIIEGNITAPDHIHIFTGDGKVLFTNPPAFVYPTWFGAKPDGETDSLPAITSAINCWKKTTYLNTGVNVQFPVGVFRCSDTLHITRQCKISGAGGYPMSKSSSTSGNATVLLFATACSGIRVWSTFAYGMFTETSINITPDGYTPPDFSETTNGGSTVINNIVIESLDYLPNKPGRAGIPNPNAAGEYGPPNTTPYDIEELNSHGIHLNARVRLGGVQVQGFKGHGIYVDSTTSTVTGETLVKGRSTMNEHHNSNDVNDTVINDCWIDRCYGHGIYCVGSDSNTGLFTHCAVYRCGGCGIYDNSLLGNTWVQCQVTSSRNACYKTYTSGEDARPSYPSFISCYVEGDPPAKEQMPQLEGYPIIVGGNLAIWTSQQGRQSISSKFGSNLGFKSFKDKGVYHESIHIPASSTINGINKGPGIISFQDNIEGSTYAKVKLEVFNTGNTPVEIIRWASAFNCLGLIQDGKDTLFDERISSIKGFLAIEDENFSPLGGLAKKVTLQPQEKIDIWCIAPSGGRYWSHSLFWSSVNQAEHKLVDNAVNIDGVKVSQLDFQLGDRVDNLRWVLGYEHSAYGYPANYNHEHPTWANPDRGKWKLKQSLSNGPFPFFFSGADDPFLELGQFGFGEPIADSQHFTSEMESNDVGGGATHTFKFTGKKTARVVSLDSFFDANGGRKDEDFIAISSLRTSACFEIISEWYDETAKVYYVKVKNKENNCRKVKCFLLLIARSKYKKGLGKT